MDLKLFPPFILDTLAAKAHVEVVWGRGKGVEGEHGAFVYNLLLA